jgi:hypothetical protein
MHLGLYLNTVAFPSGLAKGWNILIMQQKLPTSAILNMEVEEQKKAP